MAHNDGNWVIQTSKKSILVQEIKDLSPDFYIQKYLPNGIVFKRSQVIAEGKAYCDFRYFIDD